MKYDNNPAIQDNENIMNYWIHYTLFSPFIEFIKFWEINVNAFIIVVHMKNKNFVFNQFTIYFHNFIYKFLINYVKNRIINIFYLIKFNKKADTNTEIFE